jgi:hypothetical protein
MLKNVLCGVRVLEYMGLRGGILGRLQVGRNDMALRLAYIEVQGDKECRSF